MRHIVLLIIFIPFFTFSQTTKKACFLGNSYTASYTLPQIIADLATADGNTLIYDMNTPGGYTLQGHSTNSTSLNKISSDTWDYVVLQEQSQLPSFGWVQVSTDVLPYAEVLVDSIRLANPCAVPMFFDTWGRRDGDPQWDSIDTFTEMNQRLFNAYSYMADVHSGKLSPVGIGFEHINNDVSSPISFTSLYAGDGSHPSIYGSYLAACIFYELIFETSSVGNTFYPGGISLTEASYLQGVANHVINDVDSVQVDFSQPIASFDFSVSGNTVTFTNLSEHAFDYSWDFGDGNNSSEIDPFHNYSGGTSYTVVLTAEYCGNTDDTTITITLLSTDEAQMNQWNIYPNPGSGNLKIEVNQFQVLRIYSFDGKLISIIEVDQGINTIHLEPGIYMIGRENNVTKVIVN